jgi:hypothetical protein
MLSERPEPAIYKFVLGVYPWANLTQAILLLTGEGLFCGPGRGWFGVAMLILKCSFAYSGRRPGG